MIEQKRGRNVSVIGAIVQVVFTVVMIVIWLMTKSQAAMSATWMLGGGIAVWLMTALLFYVRQARIQESSELEGLQAEGRIFKETPEQELTPAAVREKFVDRWIVGLFTLLWAVYNAGIAVFIWKLIKNSQPVEISNMGRGAMFAALIGFACFLFSRYATGMGTQRQWRSLRAVGSYTLLNVLAIAVVIFVLLSGWMQYTHFDRIAAYCVAIAMLVFSIELILNFIMDIYRPRIPGEERRLSYDSRLLNLLSEPGRVGHSLAETANYQFGFEVSKTWFYQLLIKSLIPLIIMGVLVMFAMSSLVIVNDGEQYVVSRLGKIDSSELRVLEPGIRFKLPWPIDKARKFDTAQVRELYLGAGDAREPVIVPEGVFKGREIMVWAIEHGTRVERDFLIAVPPETRKEIEISGKKKVPAAVNVLKLVAVVQYRISDPYKFGYKYKEAEKLLESVANREMVQYLSSATLYNPIPGNEDFKRPEAIMTYGQEMAAAVLKEHIEHEVGPDGLDLGVEILNAGFISVHPPIEAAKEFEKVIEARLRQREVRYQAQADATKVLAEVAGRSIDALQLALMIQARTQLGNLKSLDPKNPEFIPKLDEFINYTKNANILTLQKEIELERLQGKVTDEYLTDSQILLRDYQQYLEKLLTIKNSPVDKVAVILEESESQARRTADQMFESVTGIPSALVDQARADRWKTELAQRADAEAFSRELQLYTACKDVYVLDKWLDVWDRILPGRQKFVLGVDSNRVEHWMKWELEQTIMDRVYGQSELEQANR